MRRSRKPVWAVSSIEGSNPSLSVVYAETPASSRSFGVSAGRHTTALGRVNAGQRRPSFGVRRSLSRSPQRPLTGPALAATGLRSGIGQERGPVTPDVAGSSPVAPAVEMPANRAVRVNPGKRTQERATVLGNHQPLFLPSPPACAAGGRRPPGGARTPSRALDVAGLVLAGGNGRGCQAAGLRRVRLHGRRHAAGCLIARTRSRFRP